MYSHGIPKIREVIIHDVDANGNCFYLCMERICRHHPDMATFFGLNNNAGNQMTIRRGITKLMEQEHAKIKVIFESTKNIASSEVQTQEQKTNGSMTSLVNDPCQEEILNFYRMILWKNRNGTKVVEKGNDGNGHNVERELPCCQTFLELLNECTADEFLKFKTSEVMRDYADVDSDIVGFVKDVMEHRWNTHIRIIRKPAVVGNVPLQYACLNDVYENVLSHLSCGKSSENKMLAMFFDPDKAHYMYFKFVDTDNRDHHVVTRDSVSEFVSYVKGLCHIDAR